MLHFCLFVFGGNRSFLLEDSALLFEGRPGQWGMLVALPHAFLLPLVLLKPAFQECPSTSLSPERPAFRECSRGWAVAAGMLGQACLPELAEVVACGCQAHNVLVFYP